MRKMKIGLALGSGAAKGLAHIGVIQALEEGGIKADVIAGTSIGAVVGAQYAAGLSLSRMEEFAHEFGGKRLALWLDPSFFRGGGLLKGDKIEQALRELTGPMNFSELKIPFHAVASDLVTGSEIVLSDGELSRAVRASFAIPGIFSPVKYKGHWLIDGALIAPVPTRVLMDRECDLIIAVNVSDIQDGEKSIGANDEPGILDVLMQALTVSQQRLSESCMQIADIAITPRVGNFSWTDFSCSCELIKAGYSAAAELIPTIDKLIARRKKTSIIKRLLK